MHYGIARSGQEVSEKPSLNRGVEESAHGDSWMNYQHCHIADCFSHNLDNQKKHSHLLPYTGERGRMGGRKSERERAFWLLKNPTSWFPCINPTFSQMNNRQVCQYVEAAGRKYEMHVNNALEPAEYPNKQLDLQNEHSLWFRTVFFSSWMRVRLRFVNILAFFTLLRIQSFFYLPLPLQKSSFKRLFLFVVYFYQPTSLLLMLS